MKKKLLYYYMFLEKEKLLIRHQNRRKQGSEKGLKNQQKMPFAVRSSSLALTRLLSSSVCFWVSIIPFHEALPAWRQPYSLSNPNMKIRTLCLVNCLKPIISSYSLPSNENIFHPIVTEVRLENIGWLLGVLLLL